MYLTRVAIVMAAFKDNYLQFLFLGLMGVFLFVDYTLAHSSSLEGKWTTGCQNHHAYSSRETIQVSGNSLNTEMELFLDNACMKPATVMKSYKTISLNDSSVLESTLVRATAEVLDPVMVPVQDYLQAFSISNWKMHKTYDVTGRTRGLAAKGKTPSLGWKEKVRVTMTDNTLVFTNITNNTSSNPYTKEP